MKKAICALLTLTMILAITGTALAADVSASYNNGMLTVSTTTDGWFRISVDGQGTDRSVTPRVPTLTFAYQLADGTHRISISSDIVGSGSTTIQVVNGVSVQGGSENAAQATEAPAAKEHKEHIEETVPGVEPTCTENGLSEGTRCTIGGETLTGMEVIPALGHRYKIVNHTDSMNYFECVRCGNKMQANANMAIQNRYGNIILNGEGAVADYKAAPSKENEGAMTFTLDQAAEKIVVTLDNSLIMQIMREGSSQVVIVNGKTVTTIDLYQISPSWFNTAEKVETYIFTVDSEAQITAQTMVNGELLTADTFAGVTVK